MTRLVAGRYRLISELGRGGMGVVWLARDELLGRDVAVKEVKAPPGLEDSEVERLYARLRQEGIAAARVAHPNVIKVYDVAMAEGSPWIVMELVRGVSFADVLDADGPVEPRRAAHIGGKVLGALRAGHAAGVLHRDVKPGNVLIGNDGRVVLTDFGIAMVEGSSAITLTGELVGSPEYLAPERALGRRPGPESDLWSLGVLLYVAVEGGSPFRRDTALSTLRAVVDEELPVPRRAGPLAPVIAGLLHKDPADRLPGEEAQRRLDALAPGPGRTPPGAGAAYERRRLRPRPADPRLPLGRTEEPHAAVHGAVVRAGRHHRGLDRVRRAQSGGDGVRAHPLHGHVPGAQSAPEPAAERFRRDGTDLLKPALRASRGSPRRGTRGTGPCRGTPRPRRRGDARFVPRVTLPR